MTELEEKKKKPIVEIWVTERGVRFRAYRGNDPRHIAWKMDHHRLHSPELIRDPDKKEK